MGTLRDRSRRPLRSLGSYLGGASGAALTHLGRLFLARQPLAPAADGGDELRQVDLEGVEDLVGVVLGAEADLALAGASLLDDVLGRAFGLPGDLLLGDQALLALARLLDYPL